MGRRDAVYIVLIFACSILFRISKIKIHATFESQYNDDIKIGKNIFTLFAPFQESQLL